MKISKFNIITIIAVLFLLAIIYLQHNKIEQLNSQLNNSTIVDTLIVDNFTQNTGEIDIPKEDIKVDSVYIYIVQKDTTAFFPQVVKIQRTIEDSIGNKVKLNLTYDQYLNELNIKYKFSILNRTQYITKTNIIQKPTKFISPIIGLSYYKFSSASVFGINSGVSIFNKLDISVGVSLLQVNDIKTSTKFGLNANINYRF